MSYRARSDEDPLEESGNSSFVANYIPALLAQAIELLSGEFHDLLEANGLTLSASRMLFALSNRQPMSIGKLAEISAIPRAKMRGPQDRMEAQGYIERFPHQTDRRIKMVHITAQGQDVALRLGEQARGYERFTLEKLDKETVDTLRSTLKQLIVLHRQ